MQQKQRPDIADVSVPPPLVKELEDVLRLLQERIAQEGGSPEQHFALIRPVEGLSIEDWLDIAEKHGVQGWLALSLDRQEGMPLHSLRAVLEKLVHQRDHDALTGLGNRRLFDRVAAFELQRASRSGTPLSLVMLDIDHFKRVNDTYGHATGDTVLASLGELLTRSVRVYDLAARLGGEEFCLVLPGATAHQAEELALRILEDFKELSFEAPDGSRFSATFSAGVASAVGNIKKLSVKTLLAEADSLLYEAKEQGRNRVITAQSKHTISENPALVQAEEKQFLFTGKHP